MCVTRPKDRHGEEIHIGFRVRFGNGLEGRVRAHDAWGKLQVVVIHGNIPRGHEVESKDTTITERGW